MEIIKSIRPDKYGWLLPPHDINVVNGLIDEGKFNSVAGLLPALGYCALFGVARVILTAVLFKVNVQAARSKPPFIQCLYLYDSRWEHGL
jgi:hypothetical protein